IQLPVKAIGLDFVHGDSISLLKRHGFPKDKVLAAGIVDGRNVWRADLEEKLTELETIKQFVHDDQLIIQPSCSLLHVPVTKGLQEQLDAISHRVLAIAHGTISELVTLTKGAQDGRPPVEDATPQQPHSPEQLLATARSNDTVRKEAPNPTPADA